MIPCCIRCHPSGDAFSFISIVDPEGDLASSIVIGISGVRRLQSTGPVSFDSICLWLAISWGYTSNGGSVSYFPSSTILLTKVSWFSLFVQRSSSGKLPNGSSRTVQALLRSGGCPVDI